MAMVAQWVLFELAFRGEFFLLGVRLGIFFYHTYYLGEISFLNPLETYFPVTAGCSFKYIDFNGAANDVHTLCTMSMNSLYYYVVPFLWLILVVLSMLMALSYMSELLIVPFKFIRRGFMLIVAINMKGYRYRWEYDAIWKRASPAEYHMIRLYSMNVDPQIIRLFLTAILAGERKLNRSEKKLLNKID